MTDGNAASSAQSEEVNKKLQDSWIIEIKRRVLVTTEPSATPFCQQERADNPKPELRVLHVFDSLGMGGAETWLMSLLKYFHEHNSELPVKVELDVLLTSGEKAIFDDEAKALGAKLFYVRYGRRNLLSFVRDFRKILAEGNYDAIHDHQDYIAGLHFVSGIGLLPPVRITHVHNPLYHRNHHATRLITRVANSTGKSLVSRLATHVVGTSQQIVGEYGFQESFSSRPSLEAAHCGFDVRPYQGDRVQAHSELCHELGWPNESKVVLFVGRLDGAETIYKGRRMTHKNPAFALKVMRACIATDPRMRLAVIGGGDSKRNEFEAAVTEWGLGRNIRFLGVRTDVPRIMLGSDLLIFPSVAEGLGMVAVEAQAAGLRVLASDTTPRESVVIPELIDFFDLAAPPEKWAERILELVTAEPLDAAQCNAKVNHSAFSIQRSAAQLCRMYSRSS